MSFVINRRILNAAALSAVLGMAVSVIASCSWLKGTRYELPVIKHAQGLADVYALQSVIVKIDSEMDDKLGDETDSETENTETKTPTQKTNVTKQFLTATTIQNGEFQVVGVTTMGQRLFTMRSVQGKLHIEKSEGLPDSVPLKELLALIQLVYWPMESLEAHYNEPWHIRRATGLKEIFWRNTSVVQARYTSESPQWSDIITLKHLRAGMTIMIKPLEVKDL